MQTGNQKSKKSLLFTHDIRGRQMLSPFFLHNKILNYKNTLFLNMQIEKQTFRKEERLKSRKIIKSLFESGKIIHQYPFKVLYIIEKAHDNKYPAQIGISVSKRNFKKATERNYIKRKIRESYRQNKHSLYELLKICDQKLYFFVIYTTKNNLNFSELDIEFNALIQKIKEKLNQK